MTLEPCIGVFDSGVGGVSVLRALRARLPRVRLHYIADSAYAPYGELPPERIVERSEWLTNELLHQGARLVVVACNTATAVAIDGLREHHPGVPFVGVEPGIKPAVALSRRSRVAVLATPATVASTRVQLLVQRHGGACAVTLIPCGGLADLVEAGLSDPQALAASVGGIAARVRQLEADTVVLGCTHYPFVAPQLAAALGSDVVLVDTAPAVAEQAARLWQADAEVPVPSTAEPPRLVLQSTGDGDILARMVQRWLGESVPVQRSRAHR